MIYIFFRCVNCGELYYTDKVLKIKGCVVCNKRFLFQKSVKFKVKLTLKEVIQIFKELKRLRIEDISFEFKDSLKKLLGIVDNEKSLNSLGIDDDF